MTSIRTEKRLNDVINAGGKWYDSTNHHITRRMKDINKLLEYADKIAQIYFIPNQLDGRGYYTGKYEYRNNLLCNGVEGYYPVIINDMDGKERIVPTVGEITKLGNFWYYNLSNVYVHKEKPILFG